MCCVVTHRPETDRQTSSRPRRSTIHIAHHSVITRHYKLFMKSNIHQLYVQTHTHTITMSTCERASWTRLFKFWIITCRWSYGQPEATPVKLVPREGVEKHRDSVRVTSSSYSTIKQTSTLALRRPGWISAVRGQTVLDPGHDLPRRVYSIQRWWWWINEKLNFKSNINAIN